MCASIIPHGPRRLQSLKLMQILWAGPHRVSVQKGYKHQILDYFTSKTNAYCVPKFRKFHLHLTESNSADRARKIRLEFFILKSLSSDGEIESLGRRLRVAAGLRQDPLVMGP